jgi:hypothetical protein
MLLLHDEAQVSADGIRHAMAGVICNLVFSSHGYARWKHDPKLGKNLKTKSPGKRLKKGVPLRALGAIGICVATSTRSG